MKLATEHAVTLTNYDADSMVCEICRSYIVNVHLCFETFLKDVCWQINKYGKNEYKPRIQEESYLSCAVRKFSIIYNPPNQASAARFPSLS